MRLFFIFVWTIVLLVLMHETGQSLHHLYCKQGFSLDRPAHFLTHTHTPSIAMPTERCCHSPLRTSLSASARKLLEWRASYQTLCKNRKRVWDLHPSRHRMTFAQRRKIFPRVMSRVCRDRTHSTHTCSDVNGDLSCEGRYFIKAHIVPVYVHICALRSYSNTTLFLSTLLTS